MAATAPRADSWSGGVLAPSTFRQLASTGTPPSRGPAAALLPRISLTQKKVPSTPPQQRSRAAVTSPGQWQHPRAKEVIRRQNRTRFDHSDLLLIVMNVALMAVTFGARKLADAIFPQLWLLAAEPFLTNAIYLLQAFFLLNISITCLPLVRTKDACEDIPLTPSQRQLMGLPPMSRPATPQEREQYVTPPRYSRSATPQSGSSLRAHPSESPLSGMGTPLDGSLHRSASGSPYGSPLPSPLSSGLRSGGEQRKRLSFPGSRGSPLSSADFDAAAGIGTPTKSSKASVGLNNKWLYEKGRASPRASPSGLAGFGGSGSVFM